MTLLLFFFFFKNIFLRVLRVLRVLGLCIVSPVEWASENININIRLGG